MLPMRRFDLKPAGASAVSPTLSLSSHRPLAAVATIPLLLNLYWSTKDDGNAWAAGNCSSHFSLLCFTVAGEKKNYLKSYLIKLTHVRDDAETLSSPRYHEIDAAVVVPLCLGIERI